MEIWSEQVRLQDAHQRVEQLHKAFEPLGLTPRMPKTADRRHRHRHRHVPVTWRTHRPLTH